MRIGGKQAGTTYKSALMATTAVAALVAMTSMASAGGFAIREQSAEFQGMSFAGNAAGGSLSSMFWNSAATASRDGINTESSLHGRSLPRLRNHRDDCHAVRLQVTQIRATSVATGFVAASYGNYQLTKDIYLGMAINAPFGLKTDPIKHLLQGAVHRPEDRARHL